MKKVRIDTLTDARLYGKVCGTHPELEGLRIRNSYNKAIPGHCVGCERDRGKRRFSGKLSNNFGAGRELFNALWMTDEARANLLSDNG